MQTDTLQGVTDTMAVLNVAPIEVVAKPTPISFVTEAHALVPTTNEPVRRPTEPGWVIVPLTLSLITIGYMRWSMPKRYSGILRALYDVNQASQLFREDNGLNQRVMAALSLAGLINLALLMGHFAWQMGISRESVATLSLIVITIVGLALFVKSGINAILGELTGADRAFGQHNFNHTLFMATLGLLLTPLTAIAFLGPPISISVARWAALTITILSYIMLQWRGAFIFLRLPGVSVLHLLYYLCAFELAPFSIAFRASTALLNHP